MSKFSSYTKNQTLFNNWRSYLIKEDLEVVLTNEEASEMFGEEIEQALDEGQHGEGSMARSQLGRISELGVMIQDMIAEDSDLEEWVESKITKAHDYLSTVMNHMRGRQLSERELTKPEKKEKEKIVKGMKKNKKDFQKRYGKDAESVMYATATKQAKKNA
tara:strand:+ start:252 stop:734 length:483 start_codon:yes stop_codon:yes gene_type:complete